MEFEFGQLLMNKYASENNPRRFGYYVRTFKKTGRLNPGVHIQFTDKKGDFWEVSLDAIILPGE